MKPREALAQGILDHLPYPFFIINVEDYTIQMANQAASPETRRESTCYSAIYQYDHPCDAHGESCPLLMAKERKQSVTLERQSVTKGGVIRVYEVHCHPIFDAKGNVVQVVEFLIDMTERRRMTSLLKKTQELGKIGSWELDCQTNTLTWSDQVYRIFGLEPQEFGASYDAFLQTIHPQDREAVDQAYKKSVQIGEDYAIEHRIVRHDNGQIRYVYEKCEHICDANGHVRHSIGMVQDITARKRAEEALRSNERNLAITLQSMGDGVITTDNQGRIQRMNPVAEQLTGWTLAEAKHRPFDEVLCMVNAVTKKPVTNPIQRVLATGKVEGLANNAVVVAPDGTERRIADSASPMKDDQGQMIGVVMVFSDVTAQYALQQTVKEQQALNETLLSSLPHPVMLIRREDRVILAANKTAKAMGAMVGMQCWRGFGNSHGLSLQDQKLVEEFPRSQLVPTSLGIRCSYCRADECLSHSPAQSVSEVTISDRVWDLYWQPIDEGVFLHYALDVTERKRLEEDIRQAKQRLDEEVNRARYVHERSLPTVIPEIKGLDIYAHYQPAEALGGDFYHFIPWEQSLLFYISDITGHGLDAAMMSSFVKNTIRTYIDLMPEKTCPSPQEILRFLSQRYRKEDYPEDYFISILFGVLDPTRRLLTYSGAGMHVPPLLIMDHGEIRELPVGHLPISAVIPESEQLYQNRTVQLPPGTTLFLSTDGLTEQKVGDSLYGDHYYSVLRNHRHLPPQVLAQVLNTDFRSFVDKRTGHDDITYIILRTADQEDLALEFSIPSDLEAVSVAKEDIRAFLSPYMDDVDITIMALHELLVNAVEHGNALRDDKQVKVRCVVKDLFVQISVTDQGPGFNWQRAMRERSELAHIQSEVAERGRGLGVMVTRAATDYFYCQNAPSGHTATFIKMR